MSGLTALPALSKSVTTVKRLIEKDDFKKVSEMVRDDWSRDYCLSQLARIAEVLSMDPGAVRTKLLAASKQRFLERVATLELIDKRNDEMNNPRTTVHCLFCGTERTAFDLKWNDCHNCHVARGPYDTKGPGYGIDGRKHPVKYNEDGSEVSN
eukprot:TRINITY_DN71425_c0_g1_i1.p1 TRINITY_DN71425_c0_g1~~TRINITY_DN71425_c0_g1_i1.p1  ORF type:complete len:153 (-),score=19.47 TRINITY_DN71425_c0_g1_i1:230-688(-)